MDMMKAKELYSKSDDKNVGLLQQLSEDEEKKSVSVPLEYEKEEQDDD